MNYFKKSLRQYENLQDQNNGADKASLGASDWAGLGLQLYGGLLQDKAEEEEQRRLDEELQTNRMIEARQQRLGASQMAQQLNQGQRAQNLTGFNALADQRVRAMDDRTMTSFRKSALKAMGA